MNNSPAEQQAKNIAKLRSQPIRAVCTKAKPNEKALLGHHVNLKSPQGRWSDDITCPKNSGHKEFASEGHIMPTCTWCGRVSPKASLNVHDGSAWKGSSE